LLEDDEDGKKIYYYDKRDKFNLRDCSNADHAALFIFLNRTCFNGLYRVNKSNKYNVPMGRYKNPTICDRSNLLAVSETLKKVEIRCGDYVDTLITDCQGSDLSILKTISSFIDEKKIGEIFCETHANSIKLYESLYNQYDGFKKLLCNNYEVKDFYLDGKVMSKDSEPFVEWDTHWVLKDDIV